MSNRVSNDRQELAYKRHEPTDTDKEPQITARNLKIHARNRQITARNQGLLLLAYKDYLNPKFRIGQNGEL